MADLKPCPFCGSEATMETNFGREWWVQCSNVECNATSSAIEQNAHAAAEWWDRRATDGVRVLDGSSNENVTEGGA